jgi:hypothetical protein
MENIVMKMIHTGKGLDAIPPLQQSLQQHNLSVDGNVASLKARLILWTFIATSYHTLPLPWFKAKTCDGLRIALSVEGAAIVNNAALVAFIPEHRRTIVQQVVDFWKEQVEKEEEEGGEETAVQPDVLISLALFQTTAVVDPLPVPPAPNTLPAGVPGAPSNPVELPEEAANVVANGGENVGDGKRRKITPARFLDQGGV